MKRLLTSFLSIALVLSFLPVINLGAWACAKDTFCVDGIIYSITSEDTVQVGIGHETGNGLKEKEKKQIVIPLTVEHNSKNYKVTDISEHAFEECTSIISVTMSRNVKKIGFGAFVDCSNLETIIIPDSVTEIEPGAFASCGALKKIIIPDSVTSLGGAAFCSCANLEKVTISKNITKIEKNMFSCCGNLNDVIIPDSVTEIDDCAFSSCDSLEKIKISESVSKIGEYVFMYCGKLETIKMPKCTKQISNGMFTGCYSLRSITLPKTLERIGEHAFENCRSLNNIKISKGKLDVFDIEENKDYKFKESVAREETPENSSDEVLIPKEMRIPQDVEYIGESAFAGCDQLKSVLILCYIKTVGANAFGRCLNLEQIYINQVSKMVELGDSICPNTARVLFRDPENL